MASDRAGAAAPPPPPPAAPPPAPATFSLKETLKDVVASAVGSAACAYSSQPFETIKTRMQAAPAEYPSLSTCVRRTFTEEGIGAFWKGVVPVFAGMCAENAVAFAIKEQLARVFASSSGETSVYTPFATGLVTGVFTSVVLCPSEVIKNKAQMQTSATESLNSKQITQMILKRQGIRGMFTGLESQVMRDAPFYAVFFGSYDLGVALLKKHTSLPDPAIFFITGGVVGPLGWAVVMPADVPKTIIQTSWKTGVAGDFWPMLAKVHKERGFRGLYTGLDAALLRAVPANASLFLGYEMVRQAFDGV